MKTTRIGTLVATISILAALSACKDNPVVSVFTPVNLIQNPSFEINGTPSFQNWWRRDTLDVRIVQDAPQGGGQWSLLIVPGWIPQQFVAKTFITGQTGTGVYQLTVAMKNTTVGDFTAPRVLLGRYVDNNWTHYKTISTDSTNWTTVSLLDTLTLQANDTIGVQLSGGTGELVLGNALFDLVKLVRLQ